MSVTPNNIVVYGSANMPEADGVTVGGGVDFTKRVAFYDISPNGTVDWVSSSSSDTAVKAQVTGRDGSGIIQTPAAITLAGQSVVAGSQTFERIGAAVITGGSIAGLSNPTGTAAVGDVAAMAHACVIPSSTVTTDTTYHTAQTGSANTSGTTPPLFKLQAGDGASVAAGMLIWTRGGAGPNQLRMIVATSGYGTDVVAVNRDWGTVPDNTTTYILVHPVTTNSSPRHLAVILPNHLRRARSIAAGEYLDTRSRAKMLTLVLSNFVLPPRETSGANAGRYGALTDTEFADADGSRATRRR